MKYKVALLSIFLVLLAACSSKEGTTPVPPLLTSPTPTADIESVVRSRVEATVEAIRSRLPEATPIPRLDRGTVLQFARGYKLTNEEWERFHDDFDKWRQGLLPCNASALQDRLREFAGRISLLTEEARALPKGGVVKEISDDIVEAMGTEAISLRQLRDNWSPQSTSLFELVESERATAASVRRNAEKRLANLEEATSDSSRDRVEAFSNAIGQLNIQWEQFRQDYEKFRQDEPTFIRVNAFRQLSQLVAQFADIVKASRDLPSFQNTLPMAQILAKAAEDEDLALRKLRDLFQRATSVEPGSSGNSSFFDYETQVVKANAVRREASERLANVKSDISQDNQKDVLAFIAGYKSLTQKWDALHQEYDDWRLTGGGCDQSKAIDTLGKFVVRFANLTSKIRQLPRSTSLRPLGELLVESAEREEKALRILQSNWRPFDPHVYLDFEQERNGVNKLKRQVVAGLNDFLAQYSISDKEINEQ